MQNPDLNFDPLLSPQAYRQMEGVLLGWASDRDDVLLLCEAHLNRNKSTTASGSELSPDLDSAPPPNHLPPAFLLYLSPSFKALIQASQTFQLSFDIPTLRTFSQQLQQQQALPENLQQQLEYQLTQTWGDNTPEQHRLLSLALLHPQPETDLSSRIAARLAPPIPSSPLSSPSLSSAFPDPLSLAQRQPEDLQPQVLITELQEAWEAVRVADRAKEEFMAMISHELRTPLTSIIGMSATLLRWSLGPMSDRQRDCLQTIRDSGDHLMQIIDSILDLSQTASGKTALNVQPISLKRLVQYCVRLFQEVAQERGVQLRSSSTLTKEDDIFIGDAQRLRQILTNLLDNAIKFTDANGIVRVRLSRDGALLKLKVEDTGIGISQQDRDRLFQKFQQLEDSHRRRFGGAGLGLALTKQLVELHGGRIEIESIPGQGSCFTVWLAEQPLPTPAAQNRKPQGEVVLLEEDEQSATLICELLTASGYKVFWLVDGSTALEQIQLLHPVALIVNLQFQGHIGEELVQHVHSMQMSHPPKIIGLLPRTLIEMANPPSRLNEKNEKVDAYVFTPFNPEELVAHLNPKGADFSL